MSNRVEFLPKLVGAMRNYPVSFADQLAPGETITSVTSVTASVYSGNDLSPESLVGANSLASPIVTVGLTGGVLGTIYEILVTVATSAGQVLTKAGYLAITPDLP